MRKLYLTKLLRGIKYILIFLAVYILGANILVTVANFFKENPILQLLIVMGIPAAIVFFMASSKRRKDRDKGKAYKQALGDLAGHFSSELRYVLTSEDYRAELLSGGTYVLIYILVMLPKNGFDNFLGRLLTDLAVGAVLFLAFALGNLLSWLYVHRNFRKDELL